MARIPYPEIPVTELGRKKVIVNLGRLLRHSPDVGAIVSQLGYAQFAAGALPAVDRELVIMNSGVSFSAPYEWAQHVAISASVGVTDAQRDALQAGKLDSAEFTPAQRALLAFADSTARSTEMPDTVFDAARRHYSDRQLVEAVILIGYYFLVARLSTVFQLEIDPPGDSSVLDMSVDLYDGGRGAR